MTLLERERDTYEAAWAINGYRDASPGETYLPLFLEMAGMDAIARVKYSVLDAGCGAGKGAQALQAAGFGDVRMCDLVDVVEVQGIPFHQACLWEPLAPQIGYAHGRKVDFVFCTDVLEHIPTPFTMLTVSRLLEVARRGVFLTISLMPDNFGAFVGKPLHQTVQTFPQWKEQLDTVGRIVEARDLLHCGAFMVAPR